MKCEDAAALLDAYFDGELDLVRSLEFEKHLEACAGCSRDLHTCQVLRTTLRSAHLSPPAPDALKQWAKSKGRSDAASSRKPSGWEWKYWLPALAMTASLILIYAGTGVVSRTSTEHRLAEEVVSAHVRSLLAAHLTDVTSTNQHTVKPWFNGKISFAPWVKDLSDYSFPLVGGRLDYLADRPVAALVYRRERHVINLFLWPEPIENNRTTRGLSYHGYNLLTWTKNGMNYWVISDLNSRELQEFARIVQSQAFLP